MTYHGLCLEALLLTNVEFVGFKQLVCLQYIVSPIFILVNSVTLHAKIDYNVLFCLCVVLFNQENFNHVCGIRILR